MGKKQDEIEADLINKVADKLQPQLKEHIQSLRTDLLNDFQELIKKVNIPTPEKESQGSQKMDMSGLMKGLQNGNLDMQAIGKMINGFGMQQQPAAGADGKLIDIKDLTPGQVEFMKMQNQQQQQQTLMTTILPMLLQQGQGGAAGGMMNNAMGELMNRVFMNGVIGDQFMRKMMFSMLAKKSDTPDVYQEYSKVHDSLINPIGQAISGLSGQSG